MMGHPMMGHPMMGGMMHPMMGGMGMMHPMMGGMGMMHPMGAGMGMYGMHPQPMMGGLHPMGSPMGSYPHPIQQHQKTPIVVVHSGSGKKPHIETEMVNDAEAEKLKQQQTGPTGKHPVSSSSSSSEEEAPITKSKGPKAKVPEAKVAEVAPSPKAKSASAGLAPKPKKPLAKGPKAKMAKAKTAKRRLLAIEDSLDPAKMTTLPRYSHQTIQKVTRCKIIEAMQPMELCVIYNFESMTFSVDIKTALKKVGRAQERKRQFRKVL